MGLKIKFERKSNTIRLDMCMQWPAGIIPCILNKHYHYKFALGCSSNHHSYKSGGQWRYWGRDVNS